MPIIQMLFAISSGGAQPSSLYDFTSFTFTNGTQTGRLGPSLANLLAAYDTTTNTWLNNTSFFNSTNGIQQWTVPQTGTYRIEAFGAGFNNVSNQRGARMRGDFDLTEGEVIRILVGQLGTRREAGSGGTFVVRSPYAQITDCILGAGGSGGDTGSNNTLIQGTTSINGQNGPTSSGGLNGNGGGNQGVGGATNGGGGGGFVTNGAGNAGTQSGFSFLNGGNGSTNGGFGGGGQTGTTTRVGGGGGFSGGGAGGAGPYAGGGGSVNRGTNQNNASAAHIGQGKVEITLLV